MLEYNALENRLPREARSEAVSQTLPSVYRFYFSGRSCCLYKVIERNTGKKSRLKRDFH